MQLQQMYDEFAKIDTVVIAVAQEDTDLGSHGKMLKRFGAGPPFDVVCDIGCQQTAKYHRTAAYLIDKQGIVRQVFPMLIHARPSWQAILHEIERLVPPGGG